MKQFGLAIFAVTTLLVVACTPSPELLKQKWIADSTRVADSLAIVQAEQRRIADSISKSPPKLDTAWQRVVRNDSLMDIQDIIKSKIFYISNSVDRNFNEVFGFKIHNKSSVSLTNIQFIFIEKGQRLNIERGIDFFHTDQHGYNRINYRLTLHAHDSTVISVTPGFECSNYEWVMFRYSDGTTSEEKICYYWGNTGRRINMVGR